MWVDDKKIEEAGENHVDEEGGQSQEASDRGEDEKVAPVDAISKGLKNVEISDDWEDLASDSDWPHHVHR